MSSKTWIYQSRCIYVHVLKFKGTLKDACSSKTLYLLAISHIKKGEQLHVVHVYMKHFFFAFPLSQICMVSTLIKHHKSPHYHKLNLPRHHPIDACYRMHTVQACMTYLFALWNGTEWDTNLTATLPLTTWPKTFLCVKQKLKPYDWNWIRPTHSCSIVSYNTRKPTHALVQFNAHHTFIELVSGTHVTHVPEIFHMNCTNSNHGAKLERELFVHKLKPLG